MLNPKTNILIREGWNSEATSTLSVVFRELHISFDNHNDFFLTDGGKRADIEVEDFSQDEVLKALQTLAEIKTPIRKTHDVILPALVAEAGVEPPSFNYTTPVVEDPGWKERMVEEWYGSFTEEEKAGWKNIG